MPAFIDISGQRFGRWTVLRRTLGNQGSYWDVICECGESRSVDGYALRTGGSLSCGCYTREVNSDRKIHGGSGTPEYQIWSASKQRCTNPNHIEYDRYGGRGIKFCDRWFNDFAAFYADMGPRPSDQHSIDRKNTNGDYEPSNCRWADLETQNNNKRNNKMVEYNGRTLALFYAVKEAGSKVSVRLASNRLRNGWAVNAALETPTRKGNYR